MGGLPTSGEGGAAPARCRVLVIDDEPTVSRMIGLLLDHHEVEVVGSGAEGLARLLGETPFDVVLCDLAMPGMTGMDLHERVAAVRPELARRFVFMTGGAYTERAATFLEENDNPRLGKPFKLEDLEAVVAQVAAQTRAL